MARPTDLSRRSAIVLLADGARADVFERLLAAGELPAIERHVVARGGYSRATSTFTSTTIPAHLPFLTGRFAGSANVPGYRWFDRSAHRAGLPTGPWCFRSYNGPEAAFVNRDIDPLAQTLFELAPGSVNVFGAITRGIARGDNLGARRKAALWLHSHYMHDYARADVAARELLVGSLDRHAPVRFAVLPGIDWNSHYDDPFGEGAHAAYRRVDRTVDALARKLERLGDYQSTLIAIVSDHGHCPVDEHFDLAVWLEREHGMRVAYHSLRSTRQRAQAICAVSGNAMAHLYLRGAEGWSNETTGDEIRSMHPWLIDALVAQPAVDIVATRESGQRIRVDSRHGRATLREHEGGLEYVVEGGDPFGFAAMPQLMSHDEALRQTSASGHPDALTQLAQIFRSARTGDIVVSAAPGYDLRDRFERPEHRSSHGALHEQHMSVPLAIGAPIEDRALRTADVFSAVTEWLGLRAPDGIDGRSPLIQEESAADAELVPTG